jgi:hypothetical protein
MHDEIASHTLESVVGGMMVSSPSLLSPWREEPQALSLPSGAIAQSPEEHS